MIAARWLGAFAVCGALAGVGALFGKLSATETVSAFATPLDGRSASQRHNALLAVSRLNGAVITPGQTFSFNARVGTCSRDRGYRKAPVSYNGQLIDSWGGGVCQVSTTLYNAALLAGLRIVERHRHRFCPSYVPQGRDAAVAFDDVDLRFANPYRFPVTVVAQTSDNRVEVSIKAARGLPEPTSVVSEVRQVVEPAIFSLGDADNFGRVRNTGKAGCDVIVYRTVGRQREMVSHDHYPAMARVVDYR